MPDARTMLACYQAQLAATRGHGQLGLAEQARLGSTIRALLNVVNADYDPTNHQQAA